MNLYVLNDVAAAHPNDALVQSVASLVWGAVFKTSDLVDVKTNIEDIPEGEWLEDEDGFQWKDLQASLSFTLKPRWAEAAA